VSDTHGFAKTDLCYVFTAAYHNRGLCDTDMGLLQLTYVFTITYHDRTLRHIRMALIKLADTCVDNCLL